MDLDSEIEDDPPLTLEIPRFVPVSMQELAEKHDTQVVAPGLDTSDPIDIPVAPLSNPPLDEHAKPEDEDLPGSVRPKRASRRSTRVVANGADVNTPGTPRQTTPPKPDSPPSSPLKPRAIASSSSEAHPNTKRRLSDVTVEVVITESPPSKKRKAKATTNSTVPIPTRVLRPRTSKSQSQLRR
ncbi:hypothetical protein ONZ45_g16401 [Pleurotus djamor]|nr:hypothetical protein ONZ45_g16401 [Pleurotus djamor]